MCVIYVKESDEDSDSSSELEQGYSDHDNLVEKAATSAYYPFIQADSAEWRKGFGWRKGKFSRVEDKFRHYIT